MYVTAAKSSLECNCLPQTGSGSGNGSLLQAGCTFWHSVIAPCLPKACAEQLHACSFNDMHMHSSSPVETFLQAVAVAWCCRRLETRPQEIVWAQVEKEAETGKTFVSPYPDKEGRPVVMMRPRCVHTVAACVLCFA
jgi:hypothetical protein